MKGYPGAVIGRYARALICALLMTSLGGCAVGRSIGHSAGASLAEGLQSREGSLVALEHRVADSLGTFLGERIRTHVLDQARATTAGIVADARAGADSITGDLAQSLRGDLKDATHEYMAANLAIADSAARSAASGATQAAAIALARSMTQTLQPTLDSVARAAVISLRQSVETEFRPAFRHVLQDMDAEFQREIRVRFASLDEGILQSGTARDVILLVLVAAGAVLASLLFHERRQRVEDRRALQELRDLIAQRPSSGPV